MPPEIGAEEKEEWNLPDPIATPRLSQTSWSDIS